MPADRIPTASPRLIEGQDILESEEDSETQDQHFILLYTWNLCQEPSRLPREKA